MARNRRIKKNSRLAASSMGVGSIILISFMMMMVWFLMNGRCSTITREIGMKEKALQRLEAELTREKTKWDEMKVPERLNIALTRFGLEMDLPREEQIVRMGATGKPVPGQPALARLRGETRSAQRTAVAQNTARPRRRSSAPARRSSGNGVH